MPPIIDAHTHVFNVGFLPVEGILLSRNVPGFLARATTRVLEHLLERELPQTLGDDNPLMQMLEEETRRPQDDTALLGEDYFTRFAQAVPEDDMRALADVLTPEVDAAISPESKASSNAHTGLLGANEDDELRRRLDRLFREVDSIAGPVETGEDETTLLGVGLKGIMKWLSMLVQHESRLVAAFADAWDNGSDFVGRVHLMMDMRLHYKGREPVYDFATEQIERMRAVAADADLTLIGLVAFDPFRAGSLDVVKHAIEKGFAGVKFYPPNGYKPIDNDDIVDGPAPDVVDARNLELFRWCVEEDVPVFTHCTNGGMESRPHVTGPFSNPVYWSRVLHTAGLSKLRLCLGHAGGQDGWMAPPDAAGDDAWQKSYAPQVLELCKEFDNVFCDFGYFDHLLEGEGEYFRARLENALKSFPAFPRKCCYGTDWHLMTVQKHAPDYPDRFRDVLAGSEVLRPYQDDFFYRSLREFLQLRTFLERRDGVLSQRERAGIGRILALS